MSLRDPAALAATVLVLATFGCGKGPESTETAAPPAAVPAAAELFTDRAPELGLDFRHVNGRTGDFYTAEVTAAGCGLFDYDNDGDLDLYLVQGGVLAPGKTAADGIDPIPTGPLLDRLYRNELVPTGTLRFTDVTEASGIVAPGYGMGVVTGDFDNDGWIDLYVTNLGSNQLLRNRGDGSFEDVTARAGADDPRWSVPAAFLDYDRDGWLDLYVGNYVEFDPADDKTCFRVTGARDYCGPLAYTEAPDRLLRNRGDGTFEDTSRSAGIYRAFGSALGVVTADVDEDGWIDIYVANDGRPNQLWINNRDGTFTDEALLRGAAVNAEGFAEASMGVEAADFDGDGDVDLFMAHLLGETNTLFRNDGMGGYEDASSPSGLAVPSKWATAFGAVALDFDNDGWIDVLTVNGEVRVIEELARAGVSFPLGQPNQLFRNLGGGRFEEVTERAGASFAEVEVSRGAAPGDVDNDGDTDVLVLNNNGPARLLINNVGQASGWIGFRLVDRRGRDALGATATLHRPAKQPLARRVHTDGSFASAKDPRLLFGLGDDRRVERLVVRWPDGTAEEWTDLEPGSYRELRQGTGSEVTP